MLGVICNLPSMFNPYRVLYYIVNPLIIRIMERKRSCEFRRIFTVAFLLFLAHAGGSSPARQSLTFT